MKNLLIVPVGNTYCNTYYKVDLTSLWSSTSNTNRKCLSYKRILKSYSCMKKNVYKAGCVYRPQIIEFLKSFLASIQDKTKIENLF